MLKPEIIQTVVPTIIGEIKTELISELKSVIKSAVFQAIEDAIKPLQDCINKQNDKITSLKAENEQMKGKLNKRIEQIEDRYDKFRTSNYENGISTDLYRCL
jgi:peptidoglycan hydrolase CwlO-like protein